MPELSTIPADTPQVDAFLQDLINRMEDTDQEAHASKESCEPSSTWKYTQEHHAQIDSCWSHIAAARQAEHQNDIPTMNKELRAFLLSFKAFLKSLSEMD